MNPCSTKTIEKTTPRNKITVGVINPDSSEKIFLFSRGLDSDMSIFESKKIVIADKKAMIKKQNFQFNPS